MKEFVYFSGGSGDSGSIIVSDESVSSGSDSVVSSAPESIVLVPEDRTLWNTDFSEYSVSEGLLSLVFVLLFIVFMFSVFKSSSGRW